MLIKVNRKKLIAALKRVVAICKPGKEISAQFEPLTIYDCGGNELEFVFTDHELQVSFKIKAEEIQRLTGTSLFGVNPNTLFGIVSTMKDDVVSIKIKENKLNIYGSESGKKTSFALMMKPGFYTETNKLDLSELEQESISCVELDEFRFVDAVSNLLECPMNEKTFSNFIMFYKSKNGSTCMFTTSGSVVVHFDFVDSFYGFDKDSLSIYRKNIAYVASLCDGNTLKICLGKNRVYFKIKDTVIDDGFDIVIVSKKGENPSIPPVERIITEKPIQFYVESMTLFDVLSKVSLIDGVGFELEVNGDKATVTSENNGNNYIETFDIEPISEIPQCVSSFSHKLVNSSIKKQKTDKFKIELSENSGMTTMIITDKNRHLVSVIAAQRK